MRIRNTVESLEVARAHPLLDLRLAAEHDSVAKLLPATRAALGDRFSALFFTFANGFMPDGPDRYTRDAIRFCAYVQRWVESEVAAPRWLSEVMAYEAAWLTASYPRRAFARGF
jgi:hypothetical protein